MVRKSIALFFICLMPLAFAQHDRYATDLRWDAEQASWLGFVNHSGEDLTVTVTGYADNGTVLAKREMLLAPHARFEAAANEIFEEGIPSWVGIDGTTAVAGYVRYDNRNNRFAMVPLNHISANEVWVPNMASDSDEALTFSLVNTSANDGEAVLDPVRQKSYADTWSGFIKPTAIGSFGGSGQKARFTYQDVLAPYNGGLLWDHLQTEFSITAMLLVPGERSQAAMNLPATTYRSMIIAPQHASPYGYETGFVLVNTTSNTLHLEITLYDEYADPLIAPMELEPYEKRNVPFGDRTVWSQHLFPTWYRIDSNENGLIGYQYSRRRGGGASTLLEGRMEAAAVVNLPHTPNNSDYRTQVTLINPDEDNARYFVYGYDDSGKRVGFHDTGIIKGYSKHSYDTSELFGSSADQVTWTRVRTLKGRAIAHGLVCRRDGRDMAAIHGIPTAYSRDERLLANFEFQKSEDLAPQGWTAKAIDDAFVRIGFGEMGELNDGYETPNDGDFFTDTAFIADRDEWFLGYEPFIADKSTLVRPVNDAVMYLSPYIEMPLYETTYLSFAMRLLNPEWASPNSRYGLVWRIEGDETWHWFGLNGEILLDPPTIIADCWERVCYRDIDHEVTLTDWYPMETTLPKEVAGKRIQVGMLYDHCHQLTVFRQGPTLFLDAINISTGPLDWSLYDPNSSGSFKLDDQDEILE